MAIKFRGNVIHKTGPVQGPWAGAANAGLHCKVMIDPAATPSQMNEAWIAGHDFYNCFVLSFNGAGTQPGTVKVSPGVVDSSGTLRSIVVDNVPVGVVVTLGVTHDTAGAQWFYLNGVGTRISSFTGTTQANPSSRPWNVGGWGVNTPGANAIWTLDDVTIWQGYTPTPADMVALRGGADPLTISAPTRYRWTCEVPAGKSAGDAVAVGDAGVKESLGTTVLNLTAFSGTGTSVYADPLVWTPATRVREARVSSSGKMVFFFFEVIATGAETIPTSAATAPTVTVNGVNLGSLLNPLCSGIHKYIAYTLPSGVTIAPTDVVSFDAPVQWATAAAGLAAAMTAQPAVNRAGRSSMSTETLAKTLPVGINNEWYPTASNALTPYMKNWAPRLNNFSGVLSKDATGKPLTLQHSSESASLYSQAAGPLSNGLDDTGYPGPTGLFAIGWDDTNPSVPTNFSIGSGDSTTTTVTERTDLRNFGVNGVGQVRVFDVQRKAGSTVAQTDIVVYLSNANKTPRFDNLIVHGPGDFTYTPGTPTVLDNSDPYALSSVFLDRVKGAGSLRSWFNLNVGQGSSIVEPEHVRDLTDFSWGWTNSKAFLSFHYTQASPYSATDTPYYYTPTMGEKYAATLGADITDPAATTITVSDADTAPIIIGLRLFVGGEIMRVKNVVGTAVTVVRGAEDTTPTTHAAGPIQAGYRLAATPLNQGNYNNGSVVLFTTSAPHGLTSGHGVGFGGTGWPNMPTTDGSEFVSPPNFGGMSFVHSPTTFSCKLGTNNAANNTTNYNSPCVTLAAAVTLPTTCTSSVDIPGGPQIPYGFAAGDAQRAGVPNRFLTCPHAASNDLVRKLARAVRDNSTPGVTTFWLELSNETWNFGFAPYAYFVNVSRSLYPGQDPLSSYLRRSADVFAIWQAIFDEGGRNRSGELRHFINVHPVSPSSGLFDFARTQTPPIRIDALAESPYVDGGWTGSAHQAMYGNLDADQCADLFIHGLWYRTDGQSVAGYAAAWKAKIDAYNAATGFDCKLISYEGGLQQVTGSKTKDRDIYYSPSWYFAEGDFYALCQQSGFKLFHVFALTHDWFQGNKLWGLYHHHFQPHGRGDGSDGKADNRDCMAQTKASTVNQDFQNVSVRGQAWLDWNRPTVAPRRRPRFVPRSSRARD